MWPDLTEYPAEERFPAPGFTHPDGRQAYIFSSDNLATVRRHFRWMRDHGLDGAWLQHFLVGLPGGPVEKSFPSHLRVLNHVRQAAQETGRVWALAYDIAGMPQDRIFEVLTGDWKKMVDDQITQDPRYLQTGGRPVVLIWSFYRNAEGIAITAALANRLIDFFRQDSRYAAYLVGGGDWDWRRNPDPSWRKFYTRFQAYAPWNVGNYSLDRTGAKHASTGSWAGDLQECRQRGILWLPVIYPGFSWDNLKKKPPGTSLIPRAQGKFLWEQFFTLARMGVDSAYVAMFDEVDEGTAVFKVTSSPPTQAYFAGYEGLPSDWYLRLVGEGIRMLRKQRPLTAEIPIRP
jgi:hypothetical protein